MSNNTPSTAFTRPAELHQAERGRTVWAAAATLLKSTQTVDFQKHGIRSWDSYPGNRYGWVTDTGRVIGVGMHADSMLRRGEQIGRIQLPFRGCGKDLQKAVRRHVNKVQRNFTIVKVA